MAKLKVSIVIETNNIEVTEKAVKKYLEESLENDFLEEGESIVSIKTK